MISHQRENINRNQKKYHSMGDNFYKKVLTYHSMSDIIGGVKGRYPE